MSRLHEILEDQLAEAKAKAGQRMAIVYMTHKGQENEKRT